MSALSEVDFGESDTDISFVSSDRPSSGRTSSVYDFIDSARTSRDEAVEGDMRRLKLELKQTMEMYSTACREALTAQHKLMELNHWRTEEEIKIEEARLTQEAALTMAEKEKARSKAALETAEALKQIAEVESHRRESVEVKAVKEAEELRKLLDNVAQDDVKYRKYTIEEIEEATNFFSESQKIGEGGYGPVYKCHLDHTPVAVKVLRPDAAQGKSQFQQEVISITINIITLLFD
ncbi:unnamed protein product [Lupinus luteus]|uniref:RING-type E3 ubiquitin transferase n=1 Tax=Lupinus luteus TaxID=3873 RepID=A0AAV1YGL7_LUPLU